LGQTSACPVLVLPQGHGSPVQVHVTGLAEKVWSCACADATQSETAAMKTRKLEDGRMLLRGMGEAGTIPQAPAGAGVFSARCG
jgi:hypothetical protein